MKNAVLAVAATLVAVIIVIGAFEANKPNQAAPVVQAQAASQPTDATADSAHHRFAVALGSFPDGATAQAWVDKLKAVGVPAYIETVTQAGGPTVTELRGGPFDSRADASAAIAKIHESGLFSGDASPASAPAPDATPTTYTASFDCSKAKSDSEHMICEDADLAAKDVQLADIVERAKTNAIDQAAFKDYLRQEWNKREECHDKECVSSWYDASISALKPTADNAADPHGDSPGAVVVPGTRDGACKQDAVVESVASTMAQQGIPLEQVLSNASSQEEVDAKRSGYAWGERGKSGREMFSLAYFACMMKN